MNDFPTRHGGSICFRSCTIQLFLTIICMSGLIGCSCEKEEPLAELPPLELAPKEKEESPQVEPPSPEPKAEESETEFTLERTKLAPHEGPWLWVERSSAGIYKQPAAQSSSKLAYVKRGGKVPILAEKVKGKNCSKGWYPVRSGGYICAAVGTTDPNAPGAKFAPRQPDVSAVLPYSYVRNTKNGTPVYQSTPNSQQILEYEPWLPEAVKLREEQAAKRKRIREERAEDLRQMEEAGLSVGGAPPNPELEEPPEDPDAAVPIWTREDDLNQVTLEELREGADGILAGRLMKGFYVAVNKEFDWADRKYFRTTKSVITPADRYWKTRASDFKGIEIDGETWTLPIAWVVGARKTAPLYEINQETKAVKPKGVVKKFEAILMSGNHFKIGRKDYYETREGLWLRDPHIRRTTPEKRPVEVGESERWLDVDISEQTLVAFVGDRPVYATLMSSGRFSKDEELDHSTPRGMWRVRVKHLVSTMDGNGTAAGDMSYSIEDVPYIMYFHKSYATHAAFWHQNYGYQMSHGCVNLSPLDAKWLFFFADPVVPEGAHGVWSNEVSPGSWVVIHD